MKAELTALKKIKRTTGRTTNGAIWGRMESRSGEMGMRVVYVMTIPVKDANEAKAERRTAKDAVLYK